MLLSYRLIFTCYCTATIVTHAHSLLNIFHFYSINITFHSMVCFLKVLASLFQKSSIQDNTFCLLVSGDILLATAFLSYSGPFNQEFRNLLLSDWQRELKHRRIPFGNNLNLTELLIDAPTVSEWNLQVSDLFL